MKASWTESKMKELSMENQKFRAEIIADTAEERDQYLQLIWGYGPAASAIPLEGGKWKIYSFDSDE